LIDLFEQRSARATLLAPQSEAANEPLLFAARLSQAQQKVAGALRQLEGRLASDVSSVREVSKPILRVAAEHGPELLAVEADKRLHDETGTAEGRLITYWSGDSSARDDYLSRAILQPYAAVLRERSVAPDRVHTRGHCPFCGGAAWISILKPASDSDSGFRHLGCALCGLEWNFNRISCPSCGEEDPHKLPVFQSDAYANVRIDTCETCRRYVKSIDLTKDMRPVAPIDDLVSISMDLWAVDEGYTRIEPGLAGL
jgi:formate dehydrogenase maturation protein FdhE